MRTIHVLDTQTANGIAAGEVVERPASVVKELVENAVDAGADVIRVDIEGGGIRLIRVSDNGSGMNREDALLCFLRHSTSKLRELDDLHTIRTMGFRGEALASIAAVAKVRLRSRAKGSDDSFMIDVDEGVMSDPQPAPGPEGSVFEIRELFHNTPARFKFLKRDSTEAAYVQDLMERLAFTRPDISFRFQKDGKEQLLTPGDHKARSVLYSVWGRESAEAALPVKGEEGAIQVSGYISKPPRCRHNRARQIMIVNGRVISSPLLRAALDQAGQGHFLKGQFPEAVLRLELPAETLDVNVHPQKSEVRFADEQAVFRALYHAVSDALEAASGIRVVVQPEKNQPSAAAPPLRQIPLTETRQEARAQAPFRYDHAESAGRERGGQEEALLFAELEAKRRETVPALEKTLPGTALPTASQDDSPGPMADSEGRNLPAQPLPVPSGESGSSPENAAEPEIRRLMKARLIGQVFHTYLLLEEGEDLLLIDQHAAHERILYETFLARSQDSLQQKMPAQILLKPLLLALSPLELELLDQRRDDFESWGFDFERFAEDMLLLRTVPQSSKDAPYDPEAAFRALLENISECARGHEIAKDEMLHSMACKAAVKAHDVLSYEEMQALLRQLQSMKDPFHCPHGRPVILQLNRREIEKMFGRIVG